MSVHNTLSTASALPASTDVRSARSLQSAMAVCFGLFVVGFVGFSHVDLVHNAAHDTRHANAFPCH
jgi:cobalt transporter subunit CbtB